VDICKTYRQGDQDIKALDHLSVEIQKGEFVCLMSPTVVRSGWRTSVSIR
jgi:putative ABC transport system ATP-binding protein